MPDKDVKTEAERKIAQRLGRAAYFASSATTELNGMQDRLHFTGRVLPWPTRVRVRSLLVEALANLDSFEVEIKRKDE